MLQQVLERGQDPDDFPILKANAQPPLFKDLVWVWEAFTTLGGSRQIGFNGPLPISMGEVLAYAEFRGIQDPDEREDLLHYVQYLDRLWMEDYSSKRPKK